MADPLSGGFSGTDGVTGSIFGSSIYFYVPDFFGGGYFSGTISSNSLGGSVYENDTGGTWYGQWGAQAELPISNFFSPVFTLQPISTVTDPGSVVLFSAFAKGDPSVSYQWFFNSNAISGATNTTYQAVPSTNNVGYYRVTASNALGYVNSATVSLSLLSVQCAPMIVLNGSRGQIFKIYESATPDHANPMLMDTIIIGNGPYLWADTNSYQSHSRFYWAQPDK